MVILSTKDSFVVGLILLKTVVVKNVGLEPRIASNSSLPHTCYVFLNELYLFFSSLSRGTKLTYLENKIK